MKLLFTSRINFDLIGFHAKRLKAFMTVFTILLLTTFPLPIFINWLNSSATSTLNPFPQFLVSLLATVTVFISAISPFLFFNYLFSSKSVNIYHSLPVRRRDLYITYLFASLMMVVIPFTITYGLGYILSYILNIIPMSIEHLFIYARLVIIFAAIMSMTIFVIMNTGTLSDAIIYTVILSIAPYIAYTAVQFFAGRFILGFASGSGEMLALFSPHIATFHVTNSLGVEYSPTIISSYWLILGIIINAVSIYLYQIRKSEKTEQPFTNRVFFSLITSLFTALLLVGLIAFWAILTNVNHFLSPFVIILPILLCYVIYVLLNIIKNRSTRNIREITRNYGIVVLVTIVTCAFIFISNGYGFTTRVPNAENVERIKISGSTVAQLPFGEGSTKDIFITSDEGINDFVAFHQSIVDDFEKDASVLSYSDIFTEPGQSPYALLKFSYNLDNGSQMNREFFVRKDKLDPLFSMMHTSETLIQINPLSRPRFNPTAMQIFNNTLTAEHEFTGNFAELGTIYTNDLRNIDSTQDYTQDGGKLEYIVMYQKNAETYQLNVDQRFPGTLAYLKANTGKKTDVNLNYFLAKPKTDIVIPRFFNPEYGFMSTNALSFLNYDTVTLSNLSRSEALTYETEVTAADYTNELHNILYVESIGQETLIPFSIAIPLK